MTHFEILVRYHKCSYYFCDEHLPSDAPSFVKERWRLAIGLMPIGLGPNALLCPNHLHLIVETPPDESATARARRRARTRMKVDA